MKTLIGKGIKCMTLLKSFNSSFLCLFCINSTGPFSDYKVIYYRQVQIWEHMLRANNICYFSSLEESGIGI